jgi:hypothetical protein
MNPISKTRLEFRSILRAYENSIHCNEHDFLLIEWDQENLLYHRKEYLLFEEGDSRCRMQDAGYMIHDARCRIQNNTTGNISSSNQ